MAQVDQVKVGWLLSSFEERQYAGNVGYPEDPKTHYNFDSFVPNHKQLKTGDVVVMRSEDRVLGAAVILSLTSKPGTKDQLRCPTCKITGIKRRKHAEPPYRCNDGHEFTNPHITKAACVLYRADFGDTFVPFGSAVSLASLQSSILKSSDQFAMRPIDLAKVASIVAPKVPSAAALLSGTHMPTPGAKPMAAAPSVTSAASAGSPPSSPSDASGPAPSILGVKYRVANEDQKGGAKDPFSVDPALVERALAAHARTQNDLALLLEAKGLEPLSPNGDPDFDLAWNTKAGVYVVEVKSITDANEEKQLRLGFGQVLRYRHILSCRLGPTRAVLAVERKPSDVTWIDLCAAVDVHLIWPERFYDFVGALPD